MPRPTSAAKLNGTKVTLNNEPFCSSSQKLNNPQCYKDGETHIFIAIGRIDISDRSLAKELLKMYTFFNLASTLLELL